MMKFCHNKACEYYISKAMLRKFEKQGYKLETNCLQGIEMYEACTKKVL